MRVKYFLTILLSFFILNSFAQKDPKNMIALEDSVKNLVYNFGQAVDLNIRILSSNNVFRQPNDRPPNQAGIDYFKGFFNKENFNDVRLLNFIHPQIDFNEFFPNDFDGWEEMQAEPGMFVTPNEYITWFNDSARKYTTSLSDIQRNNIVPTRFEYKSELGRKYTIVYAKLDFQGGFEFIDENNSRNTISVRKIDCSYYLSFKISYEYILNKITKQNLPTTFYIEEITIKTPEEGVSIGDTTLHHIIYEPKYRGFIEIESNYGHTKFMEENPSLNAGQGNVIGAGLNYVQLFNMHEVKTMYHGFKTGVSYSSIDFNLQISDHSDRPLENMELLPFAQNEQNWVESYSLLKQIDSVQQNFIIGAIKIPLEYYSVISNNNLKLFFGAGIGLNIPLSKELDINPNVGILNYTGKLSLKTPDNNKLTEIYLSEDLNEYSFGRFNQALTVGGLDANLNPLFVSAKIEAGLKYSLNSRTEFFVGINYERSLSSIINNSETEGATLIGINDEITKGQINDFLLISENKGLNSFYVNAGISILILKEKKVLVPIKR